jgi:hypothetical protein
LTIQTYCDKKRVVIQYIDIIIVRGGGSKFLIGRNKKRPRDTKERVSLFYFVLKDKKWEK